MNPDQEFKIQAYLDGELTDSEAREVSTWLAKDKDGQLLLEELRMMKTALTQNEPELKLPESREFFWSKIEREIQRQEAQPAPEAQRASIMAWLHRYLVPTSAAAAFLIAGILVFNQPKSFEGGLAQSRLGETEALNEEMGSISFRSESDRMTVIYLYDKSESGTDSVEAPDYQ